MTTCIDLIEQHAPDAPKGSFYTCPHGRNYRLKRKGWQPVRNPWTNRKVKQQQWEAIKAELLRICERAAAAHDAKQAVEDDKKARAEANREHNATERAKARKHANKIRWDKTEAATAVEAEPLSEPEGFEVTRVLGRAKHDAKAGDVVELDMDNPPAADIGLYGPDWSRVANPAGYADNLDLKPNGWAKVANREEYLGGFPPISREEHKRRILDAYYVNVAAGRRLDTAQGFFSKTAEEYADANRLGLADAVSLLEDAREDERKHNEATGRIAVYKNDGTPKTNDEIREEATKINGKGTTFVDLEGSPNLLTEKPKAAGGVISTEYDHAKGAVKIKVHGVRGDAAEVMEQAAASIRENGARGVWL